MPELPDLTIYLEALDRRLRGVRLEKLVLVSPFLLRSVDPPATAFEGRRYVAGRRLGKRLALEFEDEHFFVLHLMIAGRLQWQPRGKARNPRLTLAVLDFETGSLHLTEASKKRRASLHLVRGAAALAAHDPGGVEPLQCSQADFLATLRREDHTLKRTLTDPSLFAGIGNAYSDEILHRARLSPVLRTSRMSDEQGAALFVATRESLEEWIDLLRAQTGDAFPAKVTAFRPEMAVHGKFGEPCPRCGSPVQRIVHAENESNYCATCQTGGKLLADRALSRLLRGDWPRSLEELEARKRDARG
jgi:formamidopyrimidine-DNA glycosylase